MPDKSFTDPMRRIKGIPKKPQTKTSNPIKSPLMPGSSLSKRQQTQNTLRELMEEDAEIIIGLMTTAIKTGLLGEEKISHTMRLDLMKNFLPYVLPQLKSIEYIESKPSDLQPLIINMHGGQATIEVNTKPKEKKADIVVVSKEIDKNESEDT